MTLSRTRRYRAMLLTTAIAAALTIVATSSVVAAYPDAVMKDQPVAHWRFSETQGKQIANTAKSPPSANPPKLLAGTAVGNVTLDRPGPRPTQYPDFDAANLAAAFDGKGDFVRITDPGADSVLDFDNGDTITLEAWVNLKNINDGEQLYVVGKGRTKRAGFAPENQNYALRLRNIHGDDDVSARISFIFREAVDPNADTSDETDSVGNALRGIPSPKIATEPQQDVGSATQDSSKATDKKTKSVNGNLSNVEDTRRWHRWTSDVGFLENSGWHHIAVTYKFGDGGSLRGYIDGVEVDGLWDMGGETDRAPVVDDDELWIGSSMAGSDTSSFDGLIDEVAVYRSTLTRSDIERHYRAVKTPPAAALPAIAVGPVSKHVTVDILEGIADGRNWEFTESEPTTRYQSAAFGLAGLPKKYNDKAILIDRAGPYLVRAGANLQLPAGEYRLLLRARGAARVQLDGLVIAQTKFRKAADNGHGDVPDLPSSKEPGLAFLPADNQEQMATIKLDGGPHAFRLETIVGDQKLRHELGELSLSISRNGESASNTGEPSFKLLAPTPSIALSESNWQTYVKAQRQQLQIADTAARRLADLNERRYWQQRHELARKHWADRKLDVPSSATANGGATDIDRFLAAKLNKKPHPAEPTELTDDYTFLRRVTLDTIGVVPTRDEVESLIADRSPDRRSKVVDRLLADPRWADHWTSYWQDVLAENPGILKPELNNTGAFRWWIHESLIDNKPLDRFVTELVMMEGSPTYGGPAGFGIASQNDAPMAEKAHVLAKAFLAVDLKCARCHDAPYHPFKQKDTFSVAAMLSRKTQTLPKTSTVPIVAGGRKPALSITLKPGDKIEPVWPFDQLTKHELPEGVLRNPDDTRELAAALLTSAENERFANVLVNRVWTRYLGWGLVDSVDDWTNIETPHPELLEFLSRDFVTHGYDMKQLARTIFLSQVYQRQVDGSAGSAVPIGPARRRMSAEQVLDSLFVAVDKSLNSEELTFDPAGRNPAKTFFSMGVPTRGWQFASLSNERDRPALSLPVAQSMLDVLTTFGWRESRQNPLSIRDDSPNVLQPLVLANGVVGTRVASLSEDSAITRLALKEQSVKAFVRDVYLQLLSRPPAADELQLFVGLLNEGYDRRRSNTTPTKFVIADRRNAVSWANHLSPDASRIKLELERAVRSGDPPSPQLQSEWRERAEDMVWALVNSPEFVFVP